MLNLLRPTVAEVDRDIKPAASAAARRIRSAAVGVSFLLPLVVLPGVERPFSTPKFILLGVAVTAGSVLAGRFGLLHWPNLPSGFQGAIALWLAALGASAAFGTFASLVDLLLPLFVAGWFLLMMSVRPCPEKISLGLVTAGAIVACISLLQFFGLDPFAMFGWAAPASGSHRMRIFATLGNPNFVAAFLVPLMPAAAAFLVTFKRRRGLFLVVLALMALSLLATGSRSGILALLAALVWLALLRRPADWGILAALAALVVVFGLAFSPGRPLLTTLSGRYYIWRVTAGHLAERPLFGFGPGAFPVKYAEWEIEWWNSSRGSVMERGFTGFQNHAHNDYLEIAVEHGAAGLIGFLLLMLSFLVFAFRQARCTLGNLLAAASAGVVALGAVALVDFPFHRPTELFVFWTLMAVVYLTKAPGADVHSSAGRNKAAMSA